MIGTLAKRFKGILLKKDSTYASYKQEMWSRNLVLFLSALSVLGSYNDTMPTKPQAQRATDGPEIYVTLNMFGDAQCQQPAITIPDHYKLDTCGPDWIRQSTTHFTKTECAPSNDGKIIVSEYGKEGCQGKALFKITYTNGVCTELPPQPPYHMYLAPVWEPKSLCTRQG